MTAPRRLEAHSVVHVTDRGTRGEPLFAHAGDQGFWLECLGAAYEATGVDILHFCLMTNHTHLIARGSKEQVADAMWQIKTPFARRLRHRHGVKGAIFARRYHATTIDSDGQFAMAMAYVSANPVRAGVASDARAYRWSAHRALVGDVVAPPGLDVELARSLLGPGWMVTLATADEGKAPAGRPPGRRAVIDASKVYELSRVGLSPRQIAERLMVSRSSVYRVLAAGSRK